MVHGEPNQHITGEITSASMHGHLFWPWIPPDFIDLLSNVVEKTTMVRRLRRKRWINFPTRSLSTRCRHRTKSRLEYICPHQIIPCQRELCHGLPLHVQSPVEQVEWPATVSALTMLKKYMFRHRGGAEIVKNHIYLLIKIFSPRQCFFHYKS